ncbi:uncharacterized protein LOC144559693 isoform X2 [Carex rostrata]
MDNSVEKPILSAEVVANTSRSIVCAKNQKELTATVSSQNRNQVVGVTNEHRLHVECENSESSKGKGALKEVPLNAFGAGIKRRRNGSNALRVKPNVPGTNSDKEEGSRGHNGSTWADNSDSNTEILVFKRENRTCEKRNDRGLQKADSTSSSGATSSRLSGQKRERSEYSKEVEDENLEENAALMLCSLSDQRSALNVSKPVNGVHMSSAVQESNGLVGPCQVLGPRRREGFVRKRRCFYEVNLRDFNPFTIVKWRIRVYWPLDRSWYIGSVKEYDPVMRKHRVRYDDQEEEWLDLHNERFKLLLFPSDVPNKSNWNENKNPNLLSGENLEEESQEDSDATIEKILETKPVKSLLTCSLYQMKPDPLPVTSNSKFFEVKSNKSLAKNGRFVTVYSRKRFRKRKENLSSISILTTAVDTMLANTTRVLSSHCDVVLKLNVPLAMFAGWVLIGLHYCNWHLLFFLYHGALITIYPLVKLEITVSDNSFGWRYFSIEVCLRSAVSVLCFLVGMFKLGNECDGKESKVPVTSISCTISGLHGYKGRVVIGLFSFFRITNLRWAYLEKRIKCDYSCIKMEDSSSGLVDPLSAYRPFFSGVNPMMFFMNEKSTSKPPSFLPSSHHEMIPVSSFPRNSRPTTSVVEVSVDQISHVVALPVPVQMSNALIHSSTPTAPRSTLHRARPSSIPKLWPSSDQIVSRKPRSDTSSQPWLVKPGTKSQPNHQKIQHLSKSSKSTHSDYALTCYANVLVTADNRGWRECGAHVVLDFDEREGARLCVQFFRETKYFYRANHVMQPGSTNRYTHAMMWRGGRDWSLEFIERNQWFIFKEMYEECYNQNLRAVSVKNIPTPGVRTVEGNNTVGFRQRFVRGLRYIGGVGSDIDVALDPSRVIYDMDSEDEEWVSGFNGERELTEDLFERIMDKCEKLAYMNKCTEFTKEQIEELIGDVGPTEVVNEVACYWSTKRTKKGMSLIRHLQPPLWMHYQKLLDEWEASVRKILRAPHSALSKAPPGEKPAMFAFCLRPRGLQLKRPQKKLFLSSRSHGRRLNAHVSRERVASVSRLNHLNRTRVSASQFSDKPRVVSSISHSQTVLTGKRARTASSDMPDRVNPTSTSLPSDNLWFLKEDVEEFKVRDAQNAALHAANMARLKREKAQLLMQKADLAMYRARSALMISDAIKYSKL